MTLRTPIVETATLPGGPEVEVRVGVPDDPYVPREQLTSVDLQLLSGSRLLASVTTVLEPGDDEAGRRLARRVVEGLESGELAPAAGALEPLANERL